MRRSGQAALKRTMGYWEQIAVSNRKNAERRAAMHPLSRKLGDLAVNAIAYGCGILVWLAMFAPLWLWVFGE